MSGQTFQPQPSAAPSPRTASGRRWCWALWLALAGAAFARADVSKEYQVKAAFLYNFTKFVEWQADRFPDESTPIRIAVIGKNPFEGELEKTVRERKVNGRSITVLFLPTAEATSAPVLCHVVFVPAGEERSFERLAASLESTGALTVGESSRFTDHGGIVTFTTVDNKVRFEINADAAERAGLRISAQLQKLATTVRRKP